MPDKKMDLDSRLSRLYASDVPESFETGWRADIRREESIQTMKKNNRWNPLFKRIVPVLCALVLVVGGLWAGTLDLQPDDIVRGAGQDMNYARSTSSNSGAPKMTATYDAAYEEVETYDAGFTADSVVSYGAQQQPDRKLVRTADLTIRTDSYDQSLQAVQDQLAALGGYIESLYQYGETTRSINLTLRVPSDQLDAFLGSMSGLGRVTHRSESTIDMTVEYADNQARLETLYQKRDRLNALLAQAENVADLIEIESAIAETQYQIDRFETSQRSIDRQVDMSMVTLTLMEQEQKAVNPELTLGERIAAGFKASVEWLGDFGRNVIVFGVMIAPAAAIIAVLWVVWRVIRRATHKKTKEE
ncbi:MAG: DUF4349 domain-containing protein [Clostridia bacterium]|nr:DUF4349 domain-containing protein [Clostridia bacterium]